MQNFQSSLFKKGKEHNFDMADPDAYATFDTPYNYMSVMHYSR